MVQLSIGWAKDIIWLIDPNHGKVDKGINHNTKECCALMIYNVEPFILKEAGW